MVLTVEQRVFLVEHVFRNNGRYTTEVQELYSQRFPGEDMPHRNGVRNLISKFRETGSVLDAARSGRPSVDEETVEDVKERITNSPHKSVRRLALQADIPKSTAHDILKKKLSLYPYKVTVLHQLQEADSEARVHFCRWFQEFVSDNGEDILDLTFFTDEAWFHLSGYVNSQNCRVWSSENPFEFKEKPLHDQKVGVWCAISRKRIVGPIFFADTINSERYCNQIIQPFLSQLSRHELRSGWFQQDNATSHTARTTLQCLQNSFDNRIISRGLWPARSPDLTPADFFLWGALKEKVYAGNPHTLQELRAAITANVEEITPQTLMMVFSNMQKRLKACLEVGGGHFQHRL